MSDLTAKEESCLSDESTIGFIILAGDTKVVLSICADSREDAIENCMRLRDIYQNPKLVVCEVTGAKSQ